MGLFYFLKRRKLACVSEYGIKKPLLPKGGELVDVYVKLIVFGSVENTHTLLSPPTNDSST